MLDRKALGSLKKVVSTDKTDRETGNIYSYIWHLKKDDIYIATDHFRMLIYKAGSPDSSGLKPPSEYFKCSNDTDVEFINKHGEIVQLSYDGILPKYNDILAIEPTAHTEYDMYFLEDIALATSLIKQSDKEMYYLASETIAIFNAVNKEANFKTLYLNTKKGVDYTNYAVGNNYLLIFTTAYNDNAEQIKGV